MPKTEERVCPDCNEGTKYFRRSFSFNERTGKREPNGGEYYACRCGRLTFGKSGYNLRAKK